MTFVAFVLAAVLYVLLLVSIGARRLAEDEADHLRALLETERAVNRHPANPT